MTDPKKPEAKEDPKAEKAEKAPEKTEKAEKKLAVRLLADYWDGDGVRHSCAYVDQNGEEREVGAIIELPAAEARALVKSNSKLFERGDDY